MNKITVADPDEHLGLPGWIYSNPRFFAVECERVLAPSEAATVCRVRSAMSACIAAQG